jgi:hypothetical protein
MADTTLASPLTIDWTNWLRRWDRQQEGACAMSDTEPWEAWWEAIGHEPVVAPLLAERDGRTADPPEPSVHFELELAPDQGHTQPGRTV